MTRIRPNHFGPPSQAALDALREFLDHATVEAAGNGALTWSASMGGENIEITIDGQGRWRASAAWSDDELQG